VSWNTKWRRIYTKGKEYQEAGENRITRIFIIGTQTLLEFRLLTNN
jgi:hypothetical protein